jgi:glutamine amidotransferase
MCRLLGILNRDARHFWRCLRDESRGFVALSRAHGDGWGVAVHDAKRGWTIAKGVASAHEDPGFDVAASEARGSTLLAHVRRRTVGAVSLANTHPFHHRGWTFAHNGTIGRLDALRVDAGKPTMNLAGETDSELLFAFLMARIESQPGSTEAALASAVDELAGIPSLGAATFLLSDGVTLYAYRHGRPLMLLERCCGERIEAVLVASEPVTEDGPWESISEQTLIAITRESDRVRVKVACSASETASRPNSASSRPLHSKRHRPGAP